MENLKNVRATTWVNNKTLFKAEINPESFITKKIKEAVKEIRIYSFNMQNSWAIYVNKTCPRCKTGIKKGQLIPKKHASYFCHNCQLLFKK